MSDPKPAPGTHRPEGGASRPFRWQALLGRASDPVFVLDRRCRVLFVNRAWERLAGVPAERVRGLNCRRPRPAGPDEPVEDLLAHALTPPADALRGRFARSRRLFVPRARPDAPPGEVTEAAGPLP